MHDPTFPPERQENHEALKVQRIARITEAIRGMPEVNSVEVEVDYGDTSDGFNRVKRLIVHYHGLNDEPVIVELY